MKRRPSDTRILKTEAGIAKAKLQVETEWANTIAKQSDALAAIQDEITKHEENATIKREAMVKRHRGELAELERAAAQYTAKLAEDKTKAEARRDEDAARHDQQPQELAERLAKLGSASGGSAPPAAITSAVDTKGQVCPVEALAGVHVVTSNNRSTEDVKAKLTETIVATFAQ